MTHSNIRVMVRGAYDLQKLRIQTGNRIVANFKSKVLGQEPSEPEKDLEQEEKHILDMLRLSYRRITDGVADTLPTRKKFKGDELISSYTELCLLDQYFNLELDEAKAFKQLEKVLDEYPIYTEFLKNVKGVGPAMAGVLISEIDIHACKYPSSMHKYVGLDVVLEDNRGRSRRKEHLVEQTYIDRDGNEKTKMGITFNPFAKTKLMGVLAGSFLKSKSPYTSIYYNYKNRISTDPKHKDKTKLHIHNMAMRRMVKLFLTDLHIKWRELEGLEVFQDYHTEKHGHIHGS